jgi:hypothetical protein
MRPLSLDHEFVMTSNQLTYQVQRRTLPKNSDTGSSDTGGAGVGADPNAFLKVSVGSAGNTVTDTIGETFENFSFSFVGTGHDTLAIAAQTNPSFWFVDDASVTGAASTVPEPSTWAMMLAGFAGLGFLGWRGSRKTTARAA